MINAHKMLVGQPEWKRPLGRPKRRWNDNIKIYFNGVRVRTKFMLLRIGTSGGILSMQMSF
jgi:hypothetical protein